MRTTDNDDSSRKTNSELKNVIQDLFEQIREANARNAKKDRENAERVIMIVTLNEKLGAVLESQRQQRLDLELWRRRRAYGTGSARLCRKP